MKTSALAVGLLTAFTAVPASATVLFSTIHTPATPNSTRLVLPATGSSGSVPRGGPIGESFYVPTATTITDVQLQLTANNPSDGASVQIFLAPDTGTGGAGVAASPTYAGSGSTLTLTGATQIGLIADSLLPSTASGTLETFNTSTPVALASTGLSQITRLGQAASRRQQNGCSTPRRIRPARAQRARKSFGKLGRLLTLSLEPLRCSRTPLRQRPAPTTFTWLRLTRRNRSASQCWASVWRGSALPAAAVAKPEGTRNPFLIRIT
jgi:hypothetical protein